MGMFSGSISARLVIRIANLPIVTLVLRRIKGYNVAEAFYVASIA